MDEQFVLIMNVVDGHGRGRLDHYQVIGPFATADLARECFTQHFAKICRYGYRVEPVARPPDSVTTRIDEPIKDLQAVILDFLGHSRGKPLSSFLIAKGLQQEKGLRYAKESIQEVMGYLVDSRLVQYKNLGYVLSE